MFRLSIRVKLALTILLMMALLTVVLIWRLEAEARQRALGEIRLRGQSLARILAVNAAAELAAGDDLSLIDLVNGATQLPDVLYALIVDDAGTVAAVSPAAPSIDSAGGYNPPALFEEYRAPEGEIIREGDLEDTAVRYAGKPGRDIAVPVLFEDISRSVELGEVHVGISEQPMLRAAAEIRSTVFTIGGIALAVSLVLAVLYGVVISRPLRKLARGVQRIGRGDFDHRLGLCRRDEIGELACAVDAMAENLQQNRFIRNAFRLYVSRQVADQIISDPERHKAQTRGERREVTVLFADIRDFTPLSERLEPEEVVGLLNDYLGQLTEAVFAYDGTLDKFIGDCVMAVFGAPLDQHDHALRGVLAALEMQRGIRDLNARRVTAGKTVVEIGIGMSCGQAVVGNIGSEERLDYTAIGDTVNLASRLEGLAGGGEIVISEEVHGFVGEYIAARRLKPRRVKGKREPVVSYAVEGLEPGAEFPGGIRRVEVAERGVSADELVDKLEGEGEFEKGRL